MNRITFGTIMHMSKGKKPKKEAAEPQSGFLPYVDIQAFEKGKIASYANGENCLPCEEGDILIVCDGSRSGLVGFAIKGYVGSTLAVISAEGMSQKYLFYFLQSLYPLLNTRKKGTGTPHLDQNVLKNAKVCLPPLEEQARIVARIEELFSQLESGVETLKQTKEQLAVYRQAVLKEAFDTAHSSDAKQLSIQELLSTDRKGMTTGPFGTMLKKDEHQTSGVPVLGIENISENGFVNGNKIFVTKEKAKELTAFQLHTGDLIISRSGTVGEICIVPEHMDNSLLSTNLMRISLNPLVIRSDYFVYLFKSKGVVIDQVKELCKGSTRMFLNQTILKQIIFPVPSLEIQKEIIERIESRLSVCDNIEQTVDAALQQAEALRQSILKKAFEGEI